MRERRAAGAEERAAASEREREAIIKEEERAKGAAKGAASLAEEAKLILFPRSATGKVATMAKEKKKPGRSKERSMERRSEGGRLSPLEAMMPEKKERARASPCNIDKTLQRGQRLRGGHQREQRRDPQAAPRSPPSLWERAKERRASPQEIERRALPLWGSRRRSQARSSQRLGSLRLGEARRGAP